MHLAIYTKYLGIIKRELIERTKPSKIFYFLKKSVKKIAMPIATIYIFEILYIMQIYITG